MIPPTGKLAYLYYPILLLVLALTAVIAVRTVWFAGGDGSPPRQSVGTADVANQRPETETSSQDMIDVMIGGSVIVAEVADTPAKQQQGLSGRSGLGPDRGMLFVYDESRIPSFWMKDMNFALDIIWIGHEKTVVGITENISPDTYPQTFSPDQPVQYVLEVPAGYANRTGVEVGDPANL